MTTFADAIATPSGVTLNPSLGRQAVGATRSMNLCNEDLAAVNAIATALAASLTVGLPSGASTAANQSTLNTVAGAIGDAAWASGNGTLVALLKAIAANAVSTADSPVEVHHPCDVISFTPTLDTAIYASSDVLFATAALTLARANDKAINLQSLNVIDKSKQHPAFTVFYYQTNVTSAAANAANALSDADAINCLGFVRIAAADWIDLANNSFACYKGSTAPNLVLKPATGTQIVYAVGILDAGTPTFAVGDLVLKHGVVQG